MRSHISQVAIDVWSSTNAVTACGAGATEEPEPRFPNPELTADNGVVGVLTGCIADGSYIGSLTDSCIYGTAFSAAFTALAYDAT